MHVPCLFFFVSWLCKFYMVCEFWCSGIYSGWQLVGDCSYVWVCVCVCMICLCNRCCDSVHSRRRCDDASMAACPGCAPLSIVLVAIVWGGGKMKSVQIVPRVLPSLREYVARSCFGSLVGMRSRIEQLWLIGFHFSQFSQILSKRTMSWLAADYRFCSRNLCTFEIFARRRRHATYNMYYLVHILFTFWMFTFRVSRCRCSLEHTSKYLALISVKVSLLRNIL